MANISESKDTPSASREAPSQQNLSELYLVSRKRTTRWFNSSHSLDVHVYKQGPPLYNINLSPGQFQGVLRAGTSTKDRPLAWCEASDTRGQFKIILGEDKMKSVFEKISNEDYRWILSSPEWKLKGAIVDDEATLVEFEKTFQWLKIHQEGEVGFGHPDWKLIDRSTSEVHAVYLERGELQFRRSWGREWEFGVLLTASVLDEKRRARLDRRGNFTRGFMNPNRLYS